ncbi:serine/threonine protein kinase [Pseudanabaena sp. FACHB-1998]|uniref:serine/threonine-protein kinase n=1 Tax=Pseudanabaena sp. FACHB-1998 TaxID=2692858 RepID=UPI0016803AAD|nr:serine/threonine-protein kinase [Pseudanabaena sp. FACHB-1998]MBD2175511.1 serine/threonine protein kinase [Pseudanabaena sp. FACHB-1998]
MSLTEGQLVGGHYKVMARLGGGGFGETYLSEDLHLPDHPLRVIKRLSPRIQEENVLQLSRRLFETEAQVLYRLGTHPQIPQLFAHFEELSEFYLVQEYIDGNDLSHELLRGKIWEQFIVVSLLQNLLTVLSFVHKNNVIHRDIKPENIIRRRDGQLFLIDFGVVKQIASPTMIASGNTSENYTVGIGTPGYMPSEQAHGEPKFASDLYAIGMIGIQALTGMPPNHLNKDDQLEIIWREYAPKVYPELAEILSKMVKFDFRQRYQSAEAAYDAIREFADRYPISSINHSLPTIPITFETSLISNTSDRPVDQKFASSRSSQIGIWQYIQPWHIGLFIITFGAIAITTIVVLFGNSSKTTRSISEPLTTENPSLPSDSSNPLPNNSTISTNANPALFKEFSVDSNDAFYGASISPDMSIVAGGTSDRNIELWNLQTGQKIQTLKGHIGRVYDIYFSPDGKRLVSGGDDRKVIIWDVKTGKILNTLEGHQERVYTAIFSPDAKIVASSSSDRTIRLWNADTGKSIHILQDKSWIYDVSFTPDGKILASGSKDGAIRLWDVATGKVIKTLIASGSSVRSLAYSNDGKIIATAMEDNTVRLWDSKSGQLKEVLTGHSGEVHTLAFTNDDRLLATGSADKTIRIWSLKDKRTVQIISEHERGVSSVDFSNDQKLLVSGSLDGKIKVWKIK